MIPAQQTLLGSRFEVERIQMQIDVFKILRVGSLARSLFFVRSERSAGSSSAAAAILI